MPNNRIYVDVTQLAHWHGNMTGIPRVMNEFAIRFRQTNPDARFVVWVKEIGALCEVDLDRTLATHHVAYLHEGQELSVQSGAITQTPQGKNLKHLAVRAARKGLRQVTPGLAAKIERRAARVYAANYKRPEFHEDDMLFIPWGEWWDANFTNCLIQHHKRDGVRLIQIIHDVGPTVQPQYFEQIDVNPADYNTAIVPIADLVLCVSENTKEELAGWLKRNKLHVPSVKVIRLGDDIQIAKPVRPEDPDFERSGLKGNDYILFVGTIELKKNHILLYYVYKLAKVRGIKLPKLVMAGRRGWLTDATFALMTKDPEVKDSFVFMIDKPDDELAWLYSHCLFTVQPSLYEGWGIPVAESLARGVPCACSNFGAMKEIGKEFVEQFSPVSTDECLAAVQRWLDPTALEKARKRILQYRRFSWDDSFQQLSTYLKEIK